MYKINVISKTGPQHQGFTVPGLGRRGPTTQGLQNQGARQPGVLLPGVFAQGLPSLGVRFEVGEFIRSTNSRCQVWDDKFRQFQ